MDLHFTNNEKKLLLEVLKNKKKEIIKLYKTLDTISLNIKGEKVKTLINKDVKIINNIKTKLQYCKTVNH